MVMTSFPSPPRYRSQRSPVFGSEGVATSHPLAAQAGLDMLARGGTAIDAALAAAMVLTVVEPTGNGIGSDAFALIWDGQQLHGLNASGRAPRAWTPERFQGQSQMAERGWESVTVPGAVSAWVALSERFGTLDLAQLAAPAIAIARDGFRVSPIIARQWAMGAQLLQGQPGFAQAFMPGGAPPAAGRRYRNPAQADTLAMIAETAGKAFYEGSLAAAMADHAAAHGGGLSREDLAAHTADWVQPLDVAYGPLRVQQIPPNGQGIAGLMALSMLRARGLADLDPDSAQALHWQIESMKLAVADVARFVADPAAMQIGAQALLDSDYLAGRAALIDGARAQDFGHGRPPGHDTVYLCAADRAGRMISFIQSNYMGFGSGVVVPGTGISLQNRGSGFTLTPGHPNQVGPGKRPFHTIIPGFATDAEGRPRLAFGVMGGPMQPQGHVQMITRLVDAGQDVQTAIDAPRWRVMGGLEVAMEPSQAPQTLEALAAMGHRITTDAPGLAFGFGGAQMIWRFGDGDYVVGSDPRKDGQAVVR